MIPCLMMAMAIAGGIDVGMVGLISSPPSTSQLVHEYALRLEPITENVESDQKNINQAVNLSMDPANGSEAIAQFRQSLMDLVTQRDRIAALVPPEPLRTAHAHYLQAVSEQIHGLNLAMDGFRENNLITVLEAQRLINDSTAFGIQARTEFDAAAAANS